MTYRSDEVGPGLRRFLAQLARDQLAREIGLGRLDREQTAAMLRALLDPPPPDALRDAVHALTDGNPFFVEEVVSALAASGDLRVPGSVRDAVCWRTELSVQQQLGQDDDDEGDGDGDELVLAPVKSEAGRRSIKLDDVTLGLLRTHRAAQEF